MHMPWENWVSPEATEPARLTRPTCFVGLTVDLRRGALAHVTHAAELRLTPAGDIAAATLGTFLSSRPYLQLLFSGILPGAVELVVEADTQCSSVSMAVLVRSVMQIYKHTVSHSCLSSGVTGPGWRSAIQLIPLHTVAELGAVARFLADAPVREWARERGL
jgi:hypothetical protein